MIDQDNSIVSGDHIRIRYGRNADETGTVDNVTWHGNQFGAYAQVHLVLDGGQTDIRSMGDLEKVKEKPGTIPPPTTSIASEKGSKR